MSDGSDQMQLDADRIFKVVTRAQYVTFEDAELAVTLLWVPDMSVSRAGISLALKRLEQWYKEKV